MNIIKKFMDSGAKQELGVIPTGEFDLLRSQRSPKSSLECIYNDATLSVRANGRYNYDLVVRKLVDIVEQGTGDGDDDEGDFSDDTTSILSVHSKKQDEWVFSLSTHLNFRKTWSKKGDVTFIWNNILGDEKDEKVQYVISSEVSLIDIEQFLQLLYRCYYETINKKPIRNATEIDIKDIELMVNTISNDDIATSEARADAEDITQKLSILKFEDNDENDTFEDASESIIKNNDTEQQSVSSSVSLVGKQLCLMRANLYLFDPIKETFMLQEQSVKISLIETGEYEYYLSIEGKENQLGIDIAPIVNPSMEDDRLGFIFNYSFRNITLSYMLKFKTLSDYKSFKLKWTSCLWMYLNKQPWEKITEKEKQYIINPTITLVRDLDEILGFTDDENTFVKDRAEEDRLSSDDDSDEEDERGTSSILLSSQNFEEGTGTSPLSGRSSQGNKSLTVSYRNNRSYIVRGDKIGVFKTAADDDDDSGLEFVSVIKGVTSKEGKQINPTDPMMYMEDRSMILSDGQNKNRMFKLDIERGQIVEEWDTGDKNVVQYGPTKKYDQLTPEQTILGVSDKSLFKIDPRISSTNKIVQDQSKEYATKYKFSSIGTTENGYIAVGSEKGDIKLYDRLGIRAKTAIPSLGEPIRHICASADGKWLLATCDSSLLLLDLTVKTGKYEGNIGFLKSFPASENVKTYILKVSPEHASYMMTYTKNPIKFTRAYFNAGIGQKEQTIVTSSGPFAITWSMNSIISGSKKPYSVRRYDSDVVEDNFEYGTNKKVIVALKDDISLSKLKSFKHPNKDILMPKNNIREFYE